MSQDEFEHETEQSGPGEGAQHPRRLTKKGFRQELAKLQVDLFKLQGWVASENMRLVVILEGLGPAGKGGTARRISEGLERRVVQVVRLDFPGKRERGQWHFQRYVEHLPRAGKITIFDGSWYHVPCIEAALGQCGEDDLGEFLQSCAQFERTLVHSGIALAKYWFSASPDVQDRRFRAHIKDLAKDKKLGFLDRAPDCQPMPVAAVQQAVFAATDTEDAPWYLIDSNDRRYARLDAIRHLLSLVPQKEDLTRT